jgi:catechol 2,3-dioxygenase-like lactoylglutathione lyase family enzyme
VLSRRVGPLISRNGSITVSPDKKARIVGDAKGARQLLPNAGAGTYSSGRRQTWTTAMAKIRHLAIKTKSPERLATFYEEVFGMKRLRTEKGGPIYMSDGYITLALLRNRGEATPSGINHFGFQVDDIGDIEQRLKKFDEPLTERPANRPYAEYRAMDPDGNLFDVSVHGYEEAEFKADREKSAQQAKGKVLS